MKNYYRSWISGKQQNKRRVLVQPNNNFWWIVFVEGEPVALSPVIMDIKHYPEWKETKVGGTWRDPFSTSMVMGGQVFFQLISIELPKNHEFTESFGGWEIQGLRKQFFL